MTLEEEMNIMKKLCADLKLAICGAAMTGFKYPEIAEIHIAAEQRLRLLEDRFYAAD